MKKMNLINKIKSKYILGALLNYINDDKFKMKLFAYSKLFQKKFNFSISDYEIEFLNKTQFDYNNYLKISEKTFNEEYFDKQYLDNQFKNYLSQYNINLKIINTIMDYYFQNGKFNEKENNESKINHGKEIDIFSPFFDLLSKKGEIFEKFCIMIPLIIINKYKLIQDYNSIFDKLNENDLNYNSISFYMKDNDDLEVLKKLKIDFKKIIKISAINKGNKINHKKFLNILLSFNLNNSLLYLSLKKDYYESIKSNDFSEINNFNTLENLSLNGFHFEGIFLIKIPTLKTLYINQCENISFDEMTCLNIIKLYIYDTNRFYFRSPYSCFKFPNVEECELIDTKSEISHYNNLIDFNSFNSLKSLKVEDSDFYSLNNAPLENVIIYNHSYSKRSINIKFEISDLRMIKKIISMKTLKKVTFKMTIYNKERLLKIKDKNNSITDMEVSFVDYNIGDFMIYFLNFFPNLTKLSLFIDKIICDNERTYTLEITENAFCKINDIKIITTNQDVKIFCGLFKNLENIDIECYNIKDIKNILPLFNNDCDIFFINLKHFRFVHHDSKEINSEVLNNLYNNISYMPNLKTFELQCKIDDKEENFMKLKEKLNLLKLEKIILCNTLEDISKHDKDNKNDDDSSSI